MRKYTTARLAVATGIVCAAVLVAVALSRGAWAEPTDRLSDQDTQLLVRVYQIGLWEAPAAQLAVDRGRSDRVRMAGRVLAADHIRLNNTAAALAGYFHVRLPAHPTPDQQRMLDDLRDRGDADFDVRFANFLRRTHGTAFQMLTEFRANFDNPKVRTYNEDVIATVMRHMRLLEDTGLVDGAALRDLAPGASLAPSTTPAAAPARSATTAGGDRTPGWLPVVGAMLLALIVGVLIGRRRRPRDHG
jgi:predicted outer membrane protein